MHAFDFVTNTLFVSNCSVVDRAAYLLFVLLQNRSVFIIFFSVLVIHYL